MCRKNAYEAPESTIYVVVGFEMFHANAKCKIIVLPCNICIHLVFVLRMISDVACYGMRPRRPHLIRWVSVSLNHPHPSIAS